MNPVLVLGANGQVGSHLRERLPGATFWDRAVLDLADSPQVEARVLEFGPRCIVNAAAYTAVDRAESDAALAWRVNADAPAALARAAQTLDVPLLHISTDFVFDGSLDRAYRESDPVGPLNVYGRSKLAGELAITSLCTRHWILRTSWVFSEHGANFVKTMLRLAREREFLTVVDDQRGCPTYAGDLAELIARLTGDAGTVLPYGLYHVAGGTPITWCGFASAIVERAGELGLLTRVPEVRPIGTADYPTPARRPHNSMLSSSELLGEATGFTPDWRAGLERMLAKLSAVT